MKRTVLVIGGLTFLAATISIFAAPSVAASAANPVVGYLQFFRRWDTPADDHAAELFSRIVKPAPTWAEVQRLVPRGSETRALFERHLASFEEAADLIRTGRMSEDLFFDAWYAMPGAWTRAQPYVIGMRIDSGNPRLYQGFEWLASHAEAFWAARDKHPPHWHPIVDRAPTVDDVAIYESFALIWATPRDDVGREFFAALEKRAPTPAEFVALVPAGSEEYTKFDRVMCAYDQAGALMKNGILHPALFFRAWRSPREIWVSAGSWVQALRASKENTAQLYDNVEWLVSFEREWRANEKKSSARSAQGAVHWGRAGPTNAGNVPHH